MQSFGVGTSLQQILVFLSSREMPRDIYFPSAHRNGAGKTTTRDIRFPNLHRKGGGAITQPEIIKFPASLEMFPCE